MNPQSSAPTATSSDTTKYFYQPQPRDVEMTAYALLTLNKIDTERALPLVRWLTAQRNPNGGFSSTQDTVIGLQALGEYAEKTYDSKFDVQVNIRSGEDQHNFSVNAENSIVLQSYEVCFFYLSKFLQINPF